MASTPSINWVPQVCDAQFSGTHADAVPVDLAVD